MLTTFSYALAGGILAILSTTRLEQIAWKFARLIGLMVIAIVALVTTWSVRSHAGAMGLLPMFLGIATGLAAVVVVLIAPRLETLATTARVICLTGGVAGLLAAGFELAELLAGATTTTLIFSGLNAISAGLLLGSITVAWLLGHAYLTATTMTIEPMRHLSRTLLWTVALRILFLGGGLAVAALVTSVGPTSILTDLQNQWLVASLRVGLGLVSVGVFAYMVADCVRLRATQSATGILYFGSIFAYVGELASLHLTLECHWPM